MAKIHLSEGLPSFLNPAALAHVKAEPQKTKDKSPVLGSRKTRFSGVLEAATREAALDTMPAFPVSEEAIKELLDEVHSAGDDLKNRPLPAEIQRYKQAVRNFLHYVVENGYTTEKQCIGVNLKRRQEKTLVQVVDRKLEQLAAGILLGQTSQLEILARLEELTGLLVDLLQ
ncbi:MAG: DUF327 family protein [Treponema sp.]|jgi:uncharacterized protein YaaR (DUF327 family)|nr:DUF327 family protein [Treponema sp.]